MAWRGWAQRGWGCGQAWAPPGGGLSCNELITALAPPRLFGRSQTSLLKNQMETQREDIKLPSTVYEALHRLMSCFFLVHIPAMKVENEHYENVQKHLKTYLKNALTDQRFNFFIQQKCGFRKAPRKVEPRRSDTGSSGEAYKRSALIPPVEETVFYPSPYPIRTLIKPFFFTVGFTGCAFGSAAIWQYESLKSRVQSYFDGIKADWLDSIRPQKEGDLRKEINKWWNNLSDGQRTVTGIIAANVLVFCLWRVPSLQRTMMRYFTSNPASKVLCSPMLLSTFSHFSLFHMAANMYVLWSFSSSIVNILGQEQFMAVYLSAGVISNFVSYMCKVATGRYGPSLGASGAIMSVLAAVCTKIPEGRLAIIFLPMFTFTAGNALKAIIAMDTAGMILGWKFFDHAAHLGGALFGIWYITYGHELIWKNREPLVKMWHEMRTDGPKKGGGSK
ncbi:presenilin associated rhomboid like, transcript variant X1 [Ictidomys tridecemlineatus]|uniref:presenilins-associated rhomboid-like protein, mitochondrial isoform X1 n=2 Tax=Marmotini TaxID=337730 RepID=UPI00068244BA|nr:presenilins-associated rhomboid-like protein, mitochondrial isoform X1 [Ictidomys tridecemlineatus]KAG3271198.1 presenilin associated rhomboid like, transcript variant X1 [Ictidomys tridecemlineatus]